MPSTHSFSESFPKKTVFSEQDAVASNPGLSVENRASRTQQHIQRKRGDRGKPHRGQRNDDDKIEGALEAAATLTAELL